MNGDKSEFDGAIEYYKVATKLNPSSSRPFAALGDVAMKARRYGIAADAYMHAVAILPRNKEMVKSLVGALSELGISEAVQIYAQYLTSLDDLTDKGNAKL